MDIVDSSARLGCSPDEGGNGSVARSISNYSGLPSRYDGLLFTPPTRANAIGISSGQKCGPSAERQSYFTRKDGTKPNRDSTYVRCLNWPSAQTIGTP